MKYILLVLEALVLINVTGCKKHDCTNGLSDGRYSGTFRNTPSGQGSSNVSHVTLNLNGGQYSGTTDVSYYPAICNADYSQSGTTITFRNQCMWPAIAGLVPMEDTYTISIKGDSIMLTSTIYDIATRVLTIKHIN